MTNYWEINGWTYGRSSYERKGNTFYESLFDEHHGCCKTDQPIKKDKLPELVRAVFNAGTRQKVAELRSLSRYVDRTFSTQA